MKTKYSDIGAAILEIMDCQCEAPEEMSNEELIKEYDKSIAECSAMLEHYLCTKRISAKGSFRYENAVEEISYWSRMKKIAIDERRRLLVA